MSLLSVSVESELSFLWKNHNGALKEVALSDLVAKKQQPIFVWMFVIVVMICLLHHCFSSAGLFVQKSTIWYELKIDEGKWTQQITPFPVDLHFFFLSTTLQYFIESSLHRDKNNRYLFIYLFWGWCTCQHCPTLKRLRALFSTCPMQIQLLCYKRIN